jgi:hypothetical protein
VRRFSQPSSGDLRCNPEGSPEAVAACKRARLDDSEKPMQITVNITISSKTWEDVNSKTVALDVRPSNTSY